MVKNIRDDRMEIGIWYFSKSIFDYAEKLAINCHSCISVPSQYAGIEALDGSQKDVEKMICEFEKKKFLVKELILLKNYLC